MAVLPSRYRPLLCCVWCRSPWSTSCFQRRAGSLRYMPYASPCLFPWSFLSVYPTCFHSWAVCFPMLADSFPDPGASSLLVCSLPVSWSTGGAAAPSALVLTVKPVVYDLVVLFIVLSCLIGCSLPLLTRFLLYHTQHHLAKTPGSLLLLTAFAVGVEYSREWALHCAHCDLRGTPCRFLFLCQVRLKQHTLLLVMWFPSRPLPRPPGWNPPPCAPPPFVPPMHAALPQGCSYSWAR